MNAEMTPKTIVFSPDSFKGTASAADVADSLADGWRGVRPDDILVCLPMADGGEGTLDAFAAAYPSAARRPVCVRGPDDTQVDASWLQLDDGTAVVELAEASGLTLLDKPRPFTAHTFGFGQAIKEALNHGATRLLLAVGGSGSSDGGSGVLLALGYKLCDGSGKTISLGNSGLEEVAIVESQGAIRPPVRGAVVLSDVKNPLLGANGAAYIFGPQKGANRTQVVQLERNLARFANKFAGLESTPGTGAGGGVGLALLAWGATITSGAEAVAEALGLRKVIAQADLVVTGEGRFDCQSSQGKVPAEVCRVARSEGVDVALVAGVVEASTRDFQIVSSLSTLSGSAERAMEDPRRWLRAAGANLADAFSAWSSG